MQSILSKYNGNYILKDLYGNCTLEKETGDGTEQKLCRFETINLNWFISLRFYGCNHKKKSCRKMRGATRDIFIESFGTILILLIVLIRLCLLAIKIIGY